MRTREKNSSNEIFFVANNLFTSAKNYVNLILSESSLNFNDKILRNQ